MSDERQPGDGEVVEMVLAKAWGTMRFDRNVAVRLEGQRVTLERNGPEVATVVRAWVADEGRSIRAEVDFDHTAIGEAARSALTEQGELFPPSISGQGPLTPGG